MIPVCTWIELNSFDMQNKIEKRWKMERLALTHLGSDTSVCAHKLSPNEIFIHGKLVSMKKKIKITKVKNKQYRASINFGNIFVWAVFVFLSITTDRINDFMNQFHSKVLLLIAQIENGKLKENPLFIFKINGVLFYLFVDDWIRFIYDVKLNSFSWCMNRLFMWKSFE